MEQAEKEGEEKEGGSHFPGHALVPLMIFLSVIPCFSSESHFVGMLLFNSHPVIAHVVKRRIADKGKYLYKYYQSQQLLRGFVLTCESTCMLFGPPFHKALFSCHC